MIQLSGIFSESLGGTCTIRGYAKYNEIVELSYPHPGYQRPAEDEHVAEISSFITSGSNSFSPEVVLAYTAKYNYYAQGASSEVDALADIRSGKGFTSNVDGIAFKKEKAAGNGFLYTLSIPDKKYDRIEDKPFRRVDGNHRLLAIEKLIAEGQMRSNYLIPFCIIVFPDNVSMKDEKIIFHNINSKAVPIRSERLLEGIIVDSKDVLNDYLSFVVENVPVEDVKSAYDFLTIVPGQLKTICDTTHPILPIWEREKRNHCFAVRPIYMSNNDYIYSPIIMEEVRKRWIEGFLQFYPPFEIGLERTCTALYAWKNNYEHLFSSEVEVLLKESGCEYAKHDVDLRREDRRGNHPTIDVLGDYDVIGLNTTQKRIFIIECKVLQPIGSVFEHSNQQKRFFTKEKFDEKFQKRIDYFSKVAMSFFANHGYDTEGFTINPYMVVNKVFSSYYKHVQFPIVTFDELKREIQL